MPTDLELDHVTSRIFIWHRYDRTVKADLFATGLRTVLGVYLIDPFALDADVLNNALLGEEVTGIICTNTNHARDCVTFAETYSVPVYARPEVQEILDSPLSQAIGPSLSGGITAIEIAGAAPGEIALISAEDGGTAIVGDGLINFGADGFSFLPGKYCSNAKLMRQSLRQLLDFSFERILFAHGTPILARGRERLASLFEQGA